MKLELKKYPNPVLRTKCNLVKDFDSNELKKKISEMYRIMEKGRGIGLAANQAGLTDLIFVVDLTYDKDNKLFIAVDLKNPSNIIENKKMCFINPEITFKSNEMNASKEGCLSLPGLEVWVNRPKITELKFFDEFGNEYHWRLDSLLAKCCQHEIDHLNAIMIIDSKNNILNSNSNRKKIDSVLKKLENEYK